MAGKLRLLAFLWLVIACHANPEKAEATAAPPNPGTTAAPPNPGTTAAPPNPGTTAAPPNPETTAAPPNPGTTAAPPNPGTTAAPPNPGTTAAPPNPGTTAAPPNPGTTAAPPNPGTTAAPPNPGTTAAPPNPGTTAAPPNPGTTAAPPNPGTTAAPPNPGTTAAPPNPGTTAAPPNPGTTAAPPNPGTTAAPPNPGTTAAPPNPGTTAAPPNPGTTAAPPNPGTTAAPPNPGTTAAPPTSSIKPPKPGFCVNNPCGQGSTCQNRADETFVCLCLPGANYNYKTKSCENAKVFPGQLTLNGISFEDALKNNTSPKFKAEATKITDTLTEVYSRTGTGYTNSTVLEFLQITTESKLWTRSGGVIASIEIIFAASAPITANKVKEMMNAEITCDMCGPLAGGKYQEKKLCDINPCDSTTANCNAEDGSFSCTCNENHIKTNFSDRMCIACPSGKKAKGSLECEDCPFGRSGFNCNETWQLLLVIVGSVLGALLLIALILLPVLALKPLKRSKKSKNADSGDYVSPAPVKVPLVSSNSNFGNSQAPSVNGSAFGNAGVPRIPRATPTSSWDSRTNLEMTQSNSRQTPTPVGRNPRYDNHDNTNPYAQSQQSSLYSQGRPQNNPYAQNRAQVNPYAQNQGHTNPYYLHDDGRRY